MEEVISHIRGEYNCAQSIFGTYASKYGLDQDTALKIATGFGGGMGHSGRTCGAVTGAYMVLGLKFGMGLKNKNDTKEQTFN